MTNPNPNTPQELPVIAYLHKSPNERRQFLSRNAGPSIDTHDGIDTSDWSVTPLISLAIARTELAKAQEEIAELNERIEAFKIDNAQHKHTIDRLETKLAASIHYPDCWDTMAYPTIESALHELQAWFQCSNEECATPTAPADLVEALRMAHSHIDMEALRISHCNDYAKIGAALSRYEAAQPNKSSSPEIPDSSPCCGSPRHDCMGMLVEGIGNRCQAMQQDHSEHSLNMVGAPSIASCSHTGCNHPEGECSGACLNKGTA